MQGATIEVTRDAEVSHDASTSEEFSTVEEVTRSLMFRFLPASMRDVDLAETLTQACFLRAHRNRPKFRGDSSPLTWLMSIAIN
jgi:RNA polymerase sigma-70 factor (ECF subfamily)